MVKMQEFPFCAGFFYIFFIMRRTHVIPAAYALISLSGTVEGFHTGGVIFHPILGAQNLVIGILSQEFLDYGFRGNRCKGLEPRQYLFQSAEIFVQRQILAEMQDILQTV